MQYLEYTFAAILVLSTVSCPILKIINYCELYNTQDNFVYSNTLPYAELQFLAYMYDLETLFYIDIQFLLPPMLCGCDIHIATPHCVHSVLSITNHNRLGNFQSQGIVKASNDIVQ